MPEGPWHLAQLASLAEVCFCTVTVLGSKALRDREKHTQSVLFRARNLGDSDVHMGHCCAVLSSRASLALRPGQCVGGDQDGHFRPWERPFIYKGSEAGKSMRHQG